MKALLSTRVLTDPALSRYDPAVNVRLVGVGLLSAVLVAACGSEPEQPRTLPPISAAPSPSASAEPEVPPSAQAETPEGAAAFARFFYEQVGRAFAEKDPEIIRRLSAPGCEACTLFVDSLTKLRDNNERASQFSFEVVFAEAPAPTGEEVRVDVIYNTPDIQRFDASGKVIYEEAAAQGEQVEMTLTRGGSGWLVKEVRSV